MSIWTCWVDASRRRTASADSSNSGTIRMHTRWPVDGKENKSWWVRWTNKQKLSSIRARVVLITQHCMTGAASRPADVNKPANILTGTCCTHMPVESAASAFDRKNIMFVAATIAQASADELRQHILRNFNILPKHIKLASFARRGFPPPFRGEAFHI